MLYHTKGIVFSAVKFRETSLIVRIFTRAYGMQAYIVNSVRSSRSRGKIARYQPLSLLDMVVYHKPEKDIQRISESQFALSYSDIPFDPTKRAIGIFLTEVLGKTLRVESQNESLFDFLYHSLAYFDHLNDNVANFHLQLLLKASHHLGFGAENAMNFIDQVEEAGVHFTLLEEEKRIIDQLISANFGTNISISNAFRREMLSYIIGFYRIHIETLGEIKSLDILKNILN